MKRLPVCFLLLVAVLASFLLVGLWSPHEGLAGVDGAQTSKSSILQSFENRVQGEGRLAKARRIASRKRTEGAAGKEAPGTAAADLQHTAQRKKNVSDRSLQQLEGATNGAKEQNASGGPLKQQPTTEQGEKQSVVAGFHPKLRRAANQYNDSQGGGGSCQGVAACFHLWTQLTAAQDDLQEAIQLKWQANRLHDEAWFLADRLDRFRELTASLQLWYTNHTAVENVSSDASTELDLSTLLTRAQERGIQVTEDTQHSWEEWHYIGYYFPMGTGEEIRLELRAREAETKQHLDQREAMLSTATDVHYRLKGAFAQDCVGDGFPPALLASMYSPVERQRWFAVSAQPGDAGGRTGDAGEGGEAVGARQSGSQGRYMVGNGSGEGQPTKQREDEFQTTTEEEPLPSGFNITEGGGSARKLQSTDEGPAPGEVGEPPVFPVGKEHWLLKRDLFPYQKNVSFVLQYFKHPDNIRTLVERLYGCRAQMGGLTSELLVNVDNPDEYETWMHAWNVTDDFLVPVFSHNIHEQRGYNRLGRMAVGEVLVLLQDDQLPPADCSWLGDLLAAYAHYPKLAIVGLNTGVYSSKDTGWRMNALNGDNVYLRNSEINVDMQFVVEVDLAPFTMRRRVFDEVGGFNEVYSKPGEGAVFLDYELCIRAWLAGYQVAQLAMIPGMQQAGPSGTRSGKQLAFRMKNEGMNGVDFSLRLSKFMGDIDKEVLQLNLGLEPVYPDYPRPWEEEPPWRDTQKRPQRLPRFSSNQTMEPL